jgi:hypothetical protein
MTTPASKSGSKHADKEKRGNTFPQNSARKQSDQDDDRDDDQDDDQNDDDPNEDQDDDREDDDRDDDRDDDHHDNRNDIEDGNQDDYGPQQKTLSELREEAKKSHLASARNVLIAKGLKLLRTEGPDADLDHLQLDDSDHRKVLELFIEEENRNTFPQGSSRIALIRENRSYNNSIQDDQDDQDDEEDKNHRNDEEENEQDDIRNDHQDDNRQVTQLYSRY